MQFVNAQEVHLNEDSLILNQAHRFFESGRYDSSILFYEKYLSRLWLSGHSFSGIPDQQTKSETEQLLKVLLHLGTSYNMIQAPENALSVLNAGIKITDRQVIDEPYLRELLYYQIGNACLLKMDYKNSIHNYQVALTLDGKNDELDKKINQNLGGIFFFVEDYDKAIEHYQKALVVQSFNVSSDPLKTAELLINTGSAYLEKNEFIKAAEYFSKAETYFRSINSTDLKKYARLSVSLGYLFMKMKNTKDAYDQFMKASQIYQHEKPEKNEEMILLYANLAQLYEKQMVFDSTIFFYHRALSFIPDKSERFITIQANLFHRIGETYGMQKKWNDALIYYQKALELLMPADSDYITTSALKIRSPAKTLKIFRIRQDRAQALFRLGMNEDSDDLVLQSFNEYLSVIELANLISKEFGREGSKLVFNESVKDLYYGALETGYFLSTNNHAELEEQLFLINEKSRNKILLSGFMDQFAKRVSGIPDSLLSKEKLLNDEISLCVKNLLIDPFENIKEQQENYLFYLNRLIELRRENDSLKVQFENSSPVYRKLKEQETVNNCTKIQQHLLPEESLLEYFIGDTSLFIFLVKSDSLIIRRISVAKDINNEIANFNKVIRLAEQQNVYESGYELYRKLIMPVKSSLIQIKKLIIIPDENLTIVPFEALVSDFKRSTKKASNDHLSYLINEFEISYQFSSSLWLNFRSEYPLEIISRNYAGFAPVNFPTNHASNTINKNRVSFNSLPYSKNEVHDVADLVFKNGGETHLFIEDKATVKNFRDNLEDCSIIHIATHSIINDQQPGLSGLVFFPDKNEEKSRSTNEGILYLDEIFNLRINADLLVLSACATGTGKITRSEGVLAMTRGFFTAGASNIVYTLWNVTDKHTRDFMVLFFEGILAGQTYSSSLRNAKLEMLSKPETSLPMLWAPYVLLGQ